MPLAANALTTLDAVKSYLKIDSTQTYDDDRLIGLINACSTAIEDYCKRKFKEQTLTEDYDGTGTKYLLLDQYPVKSITSVAIEGITLDPSGYKINKKTGNLIRKNSCWVKGDVNITVTYTAGLTEIPAPLELACRHFVMSFFKADVASFSTTFSEGFVFKPEALPSQVKALVTPYKKVV
ncbi:head-tail connector protein [Gottfriedia acidiceleris]|uniref:head-tail connector protein n=1 Tax=Gottfriedia acidiceleris TaxID=371036 RepID=UPI002F2622D5